MNYYYNKFIKKLHTIKKDKYLLSLIFIFVAGSFLRFYRLFDFAIFLGDQGRDAIIIKRILFFEHFPAIGPTTSVGNIYLGPFYYYFMAPWLALFRLHPVGLVVGVAFLMSLFIILAYFLLNDIFDKKVAIISSFLIAFTYPLIDFSRFSWNPNVVPLFTLLLFYSVIKAINTDKRLFYIFTGIFLSICIQLHYIALALFIPVLVTFAIHIIKSKTFLKKNSINIGLTSIAFMTISIPLFIFDIRHDYLNSKNFLALFFQTETIQSSKLINLFSTFQTFLSYIFSDSLSLLISILLLIAIIFLFVEGIKRRNTIWYLLLFTITILVVTSLYSGPKYSHYFGVLYILFLVLIAYYLAKVFYSGKSFVIISIVLIGFILLQANNYYFLFKDPPLQLQKSEKIARKIYTEISSPTYQITSLPDKDSDSPYRYFLEIWGKRSLEKNSLIKAQELFVICEKQCKPIGDPAWEIAYFAPTKVVGIYEIDNVRIFKLVR